MYTLLKPSAPDNYSNMLISYIVEVMEESLKDAQGPFRELFNTFKDNEFWYAFLEQSVQLYGRLVDDGQILDVPVHVQEAITRLNDMQSVYDYPNRDALVEAIKLGDEPWYQIFNLPGYRGKKNFEAVQATEEDAKLILGELVAREFNATGKRMEDNLISAGQRPTYDKLAYLFFELVDGADFDLKGPLTEEVVSLPPPGEPSPYYTNGGELYVADAYDTDSEFSAGDDYVGYYHTNTDDSGNTIFMAGPEHVEADHDILAPYENQITVKNGADPSVGFGDVTDPQSNATFGLKKYVSINGSITDPTTARDTIRGQTAGQSLSEVYPGTLQQVTDEDGNVVGLEGELGVRNGLAFYYKGYLITRVEIDALDVLVENFEPVGESSKLLLCLINNLIEDEKFRLFTEYIFPLNKFTALYTIYNDLALLPSIGETIFTPDLTPLEMAAANATAGAGSLPGMPLNDPAYKIKPGAYFDTKAYAAYMAKRLSGVNNEPLPYELPDPFDLSGNETNPPAGYPDYTGNPTDFKPPRYGGNAGWEEYSVRKPGGLADLFGGTTWDQWDQVLLRNSKNRIKQIFKSYYYSRDFKPGDSLYEERPSKVRKQRLRDLYKPRPGITVLPFWKRRLLRPNPFIVCEKTDDNSDE